MGFLDKLFSGGFSSGSSKTPASQGGGTKQGGKSSSSTSKSSKPKNTSSKATGYSYTGKNANTSKKNTGGGIPPSSSGSKSNAAKRALEDYATQSAVERARSVVDQGTAAPKAYGFDALNAEVTAAQDKAKNAEANYYATLEKYDYDAGNPNVKSAQQMLDDALRDAKVFTAAAEKGAQIKDRRENFGVGNLKQYAGSLLDAAGTAYEGGTRGAQAQTERDIAELEQRLERAVEANKNNPSEANAAYLADVQRELSVLEGVDYSNLDEVTDKVYGKADELTIEGAEAIEKAKEGLGKGGRFAVDAASAGAQLLGDIGLGLATGGMASIPMVLRSFGGAAGEARRNGADYEGQALRGLAEGAKAYAFGKITDGLAGAYGKGVADDVIEDLVGKLAKTDTGRTILRSAFGAGGEAAEEFLEAAVDPALDAIYNGKSVGENYSEAKLSDMLYDALIGGVLGVGGSAVSIATGQDALKNKSLAGEDALLRGAADGEVKNYTPEAQTPSVEVRQEAVDYINEVLDRGRINNTAANNIINNPELTAAFNQVFPQTPLQGTVEQRRETLRNAVRAKGASEAAVKEADVGLELAGNKGIDPLTRNAIYVRDTILNGANTQTANEILNTPELKAMWEQMTGKTLPTNPKSAIKMIIQTKRKAMDYYEAEAPRSNTQPAQPETAVAKSTAVVSRPSEQASQSTIPSTPVQASESAANAVSTESGEITPSVQQSAEINAPVEFNAATAQTTMGKGPERERNMSEGVRNNPANEAELRQSFEENPEMYTQLTNAEVQSKADAILAKGFDTARSEIEQAVGRAKAGMKLAPEYAVAGHELANELTRRGELEAARNLESDIIAEFTAAGQFSQIGRLIRSNNPVAIERAIQKVLDKVSEEAHRKGFDWTAELTDAEKQLIAKTDFTQEGAYENVYTQIADRVGKEMPATVWEKLQEVRRINMLLRPRTMIKNVAGNVPMVGVRKLSEGISAAIQNQLVKSGKMDASEQTRGLATQAERDMAKAYWESHSADILRQGNKWDFNSILREHRTVFKGTALKDGAIAKAVEKMTGKEVESFGEALRQTTYSLLEKGDAPFVQSAFIDSLAQYCAARGITSVDKVPQSAVDFATANAMEATFKKANVLAKALNDLKRNSTPTVAAAIDILMPFTTTPANILSLMGEYSPVGFAKLLSKEGPAAKVDAFSKASVGSALMLMGYLLRSAGWITGGEDEDKDKAALDRATGVGTYSIGGKVSYDWAQPAGSLFALGAEISDAIAGQQSWDSAIMNAIYTAGDSVLNMSMFQNILKVLKGTGKPTQQIIDAIMEGGATQLIPGLAGDIAKIIDGTVRSTYTGGNVFDDIAARVASSTPGLSKTLPESVNVKGEVNTRGNFLDRVFDTLINPSTITHGNRNAQDEEVYRLYEATGSKTHFPEVSPYGIEYDAKTYSMNGEERAQFQKTQGQTFYEYVDQAMQSPFYEGLTDEQKQDVISQIGTYALDAAKRELVESRGDTYTSAISDNASTLDIPAYLSFKTAYTDAADATNANPNYGSVDALLANIGSMDEATRDKLDEQSGFKNLRFAYDVFGMDAEKAIGIEKMLDSEQGTNLKGSNSGASDAVVIAKNYKGSDAEKLKALEVANLPYADTGKRRSVVRRTEAAMGQGFSFDDWAVIEAYVDKTKTSDTPNKATIVAAGNALGHNGNLVYQIYKKDPNDEELVTQTNDYFHEDYVAPEDVDLLAYLTGMTLPEGEVPETSEGGGRGYGGRYRGGSSRAADLGDSVGAVKSIANSGTTTSNSNKYMRQALDDVISQSKKRKNEEPTVKWEDLLAGYVKGIK